MADARYTVPCNAVLAIREERSPDEPLQPLDGRERLHPYGSGYVGYDPR